MEISSPSANHFITFGFGFFFGTLQTASFSADFLLETQADGPVFQRISLLYPRKLLHFLSSDLYARI
jgi:hypothetical protein